jgi:RNA polymerase sigma factor (sigma-70 family)
MHHHQKAFVDSVNADRLTAAARRRSYAPEGADLEGTVLAAADGDGAAWRSLVDRFAVHIRAIARSHQLSAQDADDIEQSTWLRLLENIGGIRRPGAVAGWLTTTARRESLSTIKAGRREVPAEETVLDRETAAPVDGARLTAAERSAALAEAIAGLSDRDRSLIGLLFAEPEPSYAEISDALGMPVGSIGPTRQRCMARLRDNPRLQAVAVAD